MTQDKQFVLDTMRAQGLAQAQALQEASPEMTGTELYAQEGYIPDFQAAKADRRLCMPVHGGAGGAAHPGIRQRDLPPGAGGTARPVGFCMVHRPGQGPALRVPEHQPIQYRRLLHGGRPRVPVQDRHQHMGPSEYPDGWEDLGEVTG